MLEAKQEIPEADQHGWDVTDRTYKGHWMDNQTVPEKVLELVVCDCKKGKCTEQCLTVSSLYRYLQMHMRVSK